MWSVGPGPYLKAEGSAKKNKKRVSYLYNLHSRGEKNNK
jgi:hypothetical protein